MFIGVILSVPELAGADAAHENEEIEEVVVRGRWEKPDGLSVSASQGSVSQIEIDARPRLRPGDILEVVPGLIVTQHSGAGKSNQLFLRGFNLDHGTDFATSIDGMPINMPTHGHGQGYPALKFMLPELIDRLEFRKGPYYADVADFSSAGAAFFSTARALDSGIVKAGIGEFGFRQMLYADSFETGDGDLLAGIQYGQYDGPWVGTSENLAKYNGLFRYSESDPDVGEWGVMLMAYDAAWDSADQVPLRAVQSGAVSRLGTIDDTVGGETSRYSLSGRWHRDFGKQQVTVRAYAIDYQLNLFSNFTYFLDDPVNGDQFEQVDDRIVYGGDLSWVRRASDTLVHRAGTFLRLDDIVEVGLFNTRERARLDVVRQDSVSQLTTGAYYDIDKTWNDRWRSTLGVRADYFHFDVQESNIAGNTGTASDWRVSPKLNVVRTLSKNTNAYFSAGFGFHSNDARGTVISIDPASGLPADKVDPLVKSQGAEIGFRYFSEGRLNVSASLWILELDSELLFVGDAGNTEPTRASRRYGLEVPAYYRLNENLLVDFELALTRSAYTGPSNGEDEIPGSLERVMAAGIVASSENGMYSTVRVRHFGDRPLLEDGSVRSGDSTVWNLGLGYKRKNLDFRIELLNAFDSSDDDITYYYESRLPSESLGGVADVHFHPIEPQTYRAYVTWYSDR